MKKDKKTEVDPENLDPKNQKKKINLSTMAPALSALLVVACAGASVAAYSPKVYAVQKPSPKTESADTTAEDTAEETALEGQVFDLPDGIYEGTGTGFAGKITVAVEIKDKKIVAITVLNVEADDAAFFNRAKGVIDRIIQSQNLDVDVVSGATYSSRGIISAVKNALTGEKDSGKTAENPGKGEGSTTVTEVADAAAYKDGTYYGSATGFAGPIKVKVVISGGKIASIEIVSTSDGSSYISKASAITGKIVSSQSTNVDTVSGATYRSNGIINAVKAALESAKAAANPSNGNNANNGNPNNNNSGNNNGNNGNNNNGNNNGNTEKPDDLNSNAPTYYADGSYTVTVKCEPDEDEGFDEYNLTAAITVKGDKITAISNVSGDGDSSNDRYINWAANGRSNNVGIINQIIGLATVDMSKENAETTMNEAIANVDVVSRATCSSKALKEACKEALNQARAKFLEQKEEQESLADVKLPDGTDETGNADTELTDPENDPQEAAQEQLLETE